MEGGRAAGRLAIYMGWVMWAGGVVCWSADGEVLDKNAPAAGRLDRWYL
jgi:hypothetical protein